MIFGIKAESGGCPATEARCLCVHAEGHDGPHLCKCGGSWDAEGNIIRFPTGTANPFVAMSRIWGFDLDDEDDDDGA